MARLPPLNPLPILRYSRIDQKLVEYQIGDDLAPDVIKKKFKKGSEPIQTCAAVYRECVYWFNSEAERKAFSANPLSFIRAVGDQVRTLKHQPLLMSIIGGPTTERECSEFHFSNTRIVSNEKYIYRRIYFRESGHFLDKYALELPRRGYLTCVAS